MCGDQGAAECVADGAGHLVVGEVAGRPNRRTVPVAVASIASEVASLDSAVNRVDGRPVSMD